MLKKLFSTSLLLVSLFSFSQIEKEIIPPYNIKTVSFVQNNQNAIPVFRLGDSFSFQFDDLFGNEANYFYVITHCDYDWKPSQLVKAEYLTGFDDQRIQEYTNSLNALQIYSHYRISFPNKLTQFRVSGNYMIKILNDDKEVVFSRKFILFEELVSVPMQVRRARNLAVVEQKHNLDFAIKSATINFQSPLQNVKVMLMQNGRFDNAITNIKPQFTIGNDLIYKYDAETQFWGGNEFLFFENKDIRAANNNIARVDSQSGLYNAYLYLSQARLNAPYTYFPDINGNFIVRNIGVENNEIEADYAWVFFSLSAPTYYDNKSIYVNGMFNNFALGEENKMEYNAKKGIYEKAIMIKQGFTNFQYVIADKNGKVDEKNAIDGNFFQTENNYFALVYYRENNQRYDRIIGKGIASSVDITN
ncbi:type IX secretion system plug protein [Flavobacterium sp. 25HG05S-40]|uniref:type IX secretion system plug protein n=1 Tax=Flavobacterium sp. 25HG05S-40 TaxID=3458682 RepID=UPI0040442D20